jgi:hypothetical protein
MPQKPDPARSYEVLDDDDLSRLGRVADADVNAFFLRNTHLRNRRDRLALVALAQGAAEHRLRGQRGIWDLDIIVCFAKGPRPPHPTRRQVLSWDWGPSKFGRCPFDPPAYSGRAVDVKYWTIPDAADPVEGLRKWLTQRAKQRRDPTRRADVAHEPVILIRPRFGEVVWDPNIAPPPKSKAGRPRRPPQGIAPP